MFVGEIRPLEQHFVATIGGNKNNAAGIGTVRWKWKDDNGKMHTYDIKNILFFPQSPINILSITEFAEQFGDDGGTGITTICRKSTFFWNGHKYSRTIIHPSSNLPEMPINDGFGLSALWSRIVSQQVDLHKHHCHCSAASHFPTNDLLHPVIDSKVRALSTDLASELIHIGETLLYLKDGRQTYVKVEDAFLDEKNIMKYKVTTADGTSLETTRETLRDPTTPDIAWIPSSVPELRLSLDLLMDDQLHSIANPVKLLPLQEEWIALHERLWHLPFSIMFCLVKAGFLPKKFTKLGNQLPPCVSCLFGQAHRKPWRSKSTANGSTSTLRGDQINCAGQTVGIVHLISAQPSLVPQNKGTLTRARIWAATIFGDYYTKFVMLPS